MALEETAKRIAAVARDDNARVLELISSLPSVLADAQSAMLAQMVADARRRLPADDEIESNFAAWHWREIVNHRERRRWNGASDLSDVQAFEAQSRLRSKWRSELGIDEIVRFATFSGVPGASEAAAQALCGGSGDVGDAGRGEGGFGGSTTGVCGDGSGTLASLWLRRLLAESSAHFGNGALLRAMKWNADGVFECRRVQLEALASANGGEVRFCVQQHDDAVRLSDAVRCGNERAARVLAAEAMRAGPQSAAVLLDVPHSVVLAARGSSAVIRALVRECVVRCRPPLWLFAHQGLYADDARAVAAALRRCGSGVQELIFGSNRIGAAGAVALADGLRYMRRKPTHINVRNNDIGTARASWLSPRRSFRRPTVTETATAASSGSS